MIPQDETRREGAANFGKKGEDENNSIGSGSSDQGVDADRESQEDDILAKEEQGLKDMDREQPASHRPPPTHGLVEEGPGPDA